MTSLQSIKQSLNERNESKAKSEYWRTIQRNQRKPQSRRRSYLRRRLGVTVRDGALIFGGWQAEWLRTVLVMSGESTATNNGYAYTNGLHKAELYVGVGLVDIDRVWLHRLIPDGDKFNQFMGGHKREFFSEVET